MLQNFIENYPSLLNVSYLMFSISMLIVLMSAAGWVFKKTQEFPAENLISAFLGIIAARETASSLEFFVGKDLSFINQGSFANLFFGIKAALGCFIAAAFASSFFKWMQTFNSRTLQTNESKRQHPGHAKESEGPISNQSIIVDASALSDPRILDLARSHFLDNVLVVPEEMIKLLQKENRDGDEKAGLALEFLEELEEMSHLNLKRFIDVNKQPPHILAKKYDAKLLVKELGKLSSSEDTHCISLNHLSQALKPHATSGETLHIKIQRYGKEPRQGVGYLDDGSMVVVNGGAEYIGKTIQALVLSVKHTSSGRMIFCNTTDEEDLCVSHAALKKPMFQHPIRSSLTREQ